MNDAERKAYANGQRAGREETKTWTLVLNKYQRDNLLGLFRLIASYEKNPLEPNRSVEPFHLANTGDWFGEIYWWLYDTRLDREEDERPNVSVVEMKKRVQQWLGTKMMWSDD